jgi:hypothetical protein
VDRTIRGGIGNWRILHINCWANDDARRSNIGNAAWIEWIRAKRDLESGITVAIRIRIQRAGAVSRLFKWVTPAFVYTVSIMDILESLEVRWFLPADSQAGSALERSFASAEQEGARVDHYLAIGRHDVSFKARVVDDQPAKVETKYLLGSLGIVQLMPATIGELQRWTKLSLELDDPKLRNQGLWVSVTKKRRLRKYAVTLGPPPTATEVPIKERPPVGCGVELTDLTYTINGACRRERTYGLEAFGPATQLLDVLQVTCRAIVGTSAPPELPASWTASYSTWLLGKT